MNLGRLLESFPGRVFRKFNEDQAPKHAVLIAWNSLFAMFPILIFTASILGLFLSRATFKAQQFYITVSFIIPDPAARAPLTDALQSARQQTGLFFLVGLAGLLWGGANLFGTMEDTFAVIYHTKNRGLIGQKLLAFAMMLLFTILAGGVVLTSSLLPLLGQLPYTPALLSNTVVAFVLQVVLGVVAGFVLFSAIYFVVPNRKQTYRQVVFGAATAAVLFELLTLVFPLYIALNRGWSTYGKGLALLFVLLSFFYLLGLVVMVGVEVNSVLYPVPIEQPHPPAVLGPLRAPAALDGGPVIADAERVRSHGRWRVAFVAAAVGSALGLLVGRRSRDSR